MLSLKNEHLCHSLSDYLRNKLINNPRVRNPSLSCLEIRGYLIFTIIITIYNNSIDVENHCTVTELGQASVSGAKNSF